MFCVYSFTVAMFLVVMIFCVSGSWCVVSPVFVYVSRSSSSARPWMDSLDPETLYVSPEQTGQATLPLPNLEVSNLALGG